MGQDSGEVWSIQDTVYSLSHLSLTRSYSLSQPPYHPPHLLPFLNSYAGTMKEHHYTAKSTTYIKLSSRPLTPTATSAPTFSADPPFLDSSILISFYPSFHPTHRTVKDLHPRKCAALRSSRALWFLRSTSSISSKRSSQQYIPSITLRHLLLSPIFLLTSL